MHCLSNVFYCIGVRTDLAIPNSLQSCFAEVHAVKFVHAAKFVHSIFLFLFSKCFACRKIKECQIQRWPILGIVLVLEPLTARLYIQFDCKFFFFDFFHAPLKPPHTPRCIAIHFPQNSPRHGSKMPHKSLYTKNKEFLGWPCV